MKSSLASRLGDIPGVASVVIDLEGFGRGIDVRLEPGADEVAVMEKLRALLAAYGVREDRKPAANPPQRRRPDPDVEVSIEPTKSGARIQASTKSVRSFRIVAANPISVVQGLADAWCQVVGRIPLEITRVEVDEHDRLVITAFDGENATVGRGRIDDGWVPALTGAMADLLRGTGAPDLERAAS